MTTAPATRAHSQQHLRPQHLAELAASKIPEGIIALAGIRYMDDAEARDFGFRGPGRLSGMFFPYFDPLAGLFSDRFGRLKPDLQSVDRKYLSPVGESSRLYFIGGTPIADLADATLPILLCEGEKKSLSVHAWAQRNDRRCLVIGTGGCWGWRRPVRGLLPDGSTGKIGSEPIPDLDMIVWMRRDVTIALDGDVVSNWHVRAAETALVKELSRRG